MNRLRCILNILALALIAGTLCFHFALTIIPKDSQVLYGYLLSDSINSFEKAKHRDNIDKLLKCVNQSSCILPSLEVTVRFKIYLCKRLSRIGIRFYTLVKEGFIRHPAVDLVSSIIDAEYVIYLPGSTPWHKTECSDTYLSNRLVVLDEFDGASAFMPATSQEDLLLKYGNASWNFMLFKRSYVQRKNGTFKSYPFHHRKDFFPMTYSIADSYISNSFNHNRSFKIVCTLRGDPKYQPSRLRVIEWLTEYMGTYSLPSHEVVIGEVNMMPHVTKVIFL